GEQRAKIDASHKCAQSEDTLQSRASSQANRITGCDCPVPCRHGLCGEKCDLQLVTFAACLCRQSYLGRLEKCARSTTTAENGFRKQGTGFLQHASHRVRGRLIAYSLKE